MEIHWLAGIHFFSAQSLPHKYIPSIPVLSPPLSFFFLLPHQKCKEVFSFLRLAPRENSQSIPHTLTWKLIYCYQVKCSILHHRLPPISTGFEYSLLLHFLHASVFLYFNFFACITGQKLETTWDQKARIFIFISPAFGIVPNTQ